MKQQTSNTENTNQPNPAVIPPEIKGWNWGAFWWTWIWAITNNVYIGLLALIPGANFVISIVLGLKGSEWAWENMRWDSVAHFKSFQQKWALAGWIMFGLGMLSVALLAASISQTTNG